jgi:hypothetical protein
MTMLRSQAHVPTPLADRYIAQLCKHFGHKIPASHSETDGRIEFPFGLCTLLARDEELVLVAEAADEASLARVEDVCGSHLERFMWREQPVVSWARDLS